MKLKKSNFLFLVIAIVFFNCSNEKAHEELVTNLDPSKYYEELNISYGEDSNQKFDLYLPANRTANTKVMILVHGGGWKSGDKADMDAIKDLLQQDFLEIAIVNINYRLANKNNNPYPMQIDDITTIVNYLNDNKAKYTISEAIGFIGTSAGAHLSLLWSYAFDTANKVNMVCSIVGPTNFTDPAYLNNTNPDVQELINLFGIDATISFLEEVSPYHQATTTSPPTILFYGGQDPLIPTTQGTDMRDKLQSLGVTHKFTLYPDAGHGWVGLELIDTWVKLKAFIEASL
ncbi:alpha/beta hydrolase [Sabulilitoribacter arenilitoris]|uniref:Alpha/beta hydrolase n=1 Tax=Wocania arenilitoris TaxID=2044858 RepID=A0AAE3JML2_9FLAO|nr:alpha/beta hydrolase [Wocania arenilitoris]MCF7569454.1 alpha/beta hydrolase [Wocania arenilitoris]